MASICSVRASVSDVTAPRQLSRNVVRSSLCSRTTSHRSNALGLGSSLTPSLSTKLQPAIPSGGRVHGRRNATVALFKFLKKPQKIARETVIPDPDYRISVVLLGAAGASAYADNLVAAVPLGILGLFLLLQTTRVKFVFEDEDLEVKIGDELQDSGENAFVGGRNRWKFSSFVNWEFWWPSFPVLVYFKETQTKPEGQIHFFPVLFNGKQLYDLMVERAGSTKTSGPK